MLLENKNGCIMKKYLKSLLFSSLVLCIFILSGCKTDVTVLIHDDGSSDITINCGSGKAFSKLILTASGQEDLLNVADIKADLENEGFTNVSVKSEGNLEYTIHMTDKNRTSYLFNSGILSVTHINPSAENLLTFYNSVDEQIQAIFDIFLAPVITGEEMSANQYISLISMIYGKDAGDELKNSYVNVTICDDRNNKNSVSYLMADILCGNIK